MKCIVCAVCLLWVGAQGFADETPYTEGPVVNLTFVKVKAGGFDQYMKFLATDWKAFMESCKKEGLLTSYRVISGSAVNRDDWDLMLVAEYKNMAALDGLEAKMRPLLEKQAGSASKAEEQAGKRGEIREIVGEKLTRELILK